MSHDRGVPKFEPNLILTADHHRRVRLEIVHSSSLHLGVFIMATRLLTVNEMLLSAIRFHWKLGRPDLYFVQEVELALFEQRFKKTRI